MTAKEYQLLAMKTANNEVLTNEQMMLNAALGLNGEAGEIADIVKKNIFQGHDLDENHFKNELGDICWYLNLAAYTLGITIEDLMILNVAKLAKRFPGGKFNVEDSINRDEKDI